MDSSASMVYSVLLTTALLLLIPPSRAISHQIDYNDERGEYCYNESFNLGTCLGKQQQDRLDLTEERLLKCMQCSGHFNGDETCDELKALNDVELGSDGSDGSINWHESFCETYDMCVETNCPSECQNEQDAWIQCLVIELDCDWRCPGKAWMEGSMSVGMDLGMGNNGAAAVGLLRPMTCIMLGALFIGCVL